MTTDTHNQELYVGPRPFEYKDRKLFFGRDKESRDLLSLAVAHRALLVYAQSGAGKTSLINTRLIPDLETEGFDVLGVVRMQFPLKDETLAGVENIFIYKTLLNLAANADVDETLKRMTLSQYLQNREFTSDNDGYPVPRAIIFDQFEEIFTLHTERWEDRKGFFIQISDAIEQLGKGKLKDVPPLWVVFVMREDFIANLDYYASDLPENLRIRYRLERLRENAAIQAIKGPLKDSNVSFDEGVVEDLVNELLEIRVETGSGEIREVKGEYVEPVQLQLVCQSLLQNLPPDVTKIRKKDIEKFADIDKTLSRFYSDAVHNAVEKAFLNEGTLRDWVENVLITPSGTRGTVHRGQETTAGISNEVMQILESSHVIRAEFRSGAHWYELAHDRFIEPILESNKVFRARISGQHGGDDESQKAVRLFTNAEKFKESGNYKAALDSYTKAKQYFDKLNDPRVTNVMKGIGELYILRKKYDKAISSFEEALQLNKIVNDQWGILSIRANIAKTYRLMGMIERSENLFNEIVRDVAQLSDQDADDYFAKLKYMEDLFVPRQALFEQLRSDFIEGIQKNKQTFSKDLSLSVPLTRPAYSNRMALILASMAKLAYLRFEDSEPDYIRLEQTLNQGGFNLIKTFSSQDTHAFLAKNKSFAVLAFRGIESNRINDFSVDLKIYLQETRSGKVHSGYDWAIKGILDELVNVLRYQKLPLYLTGHSVGAPLAVMALANLERHESTTDQVAACYTFGSPRIGMGYFDEMMKTPVYRVVNATDIVTVIPLLSMGFVHIGDVRFLGSRDGDIRREIPILRRQFLFLAALFQFFAPLVKDHSIDQYRRKLEIITLNRNFDSYSDRESVGR